MADYNILDYGARGDGQSNDAAARPDLPPVVQD
jgi:hypothetical protein